MNSWALPLLRPTVAVADESYGNSGSGRRRELDWILYKRRSGPSRASPNTHHLENLDCSYISTNFLPSISCVKRRSCRMSTEGNKVRID